jgi:hypothetical protein
MMETTVAVSKYDEWGTLSFWREQAPSLRIGDGDLFTSLPIFNVDEKSTRALQSVMRTEGYFQLPPVDWQLPIDLMIALIAKLDAAGIPVPFAFVYDEFWAMSVKLHRLLEPQLGPGYLRLPDFWVWYVDPRRDDRGWKPHRDKTVGTLRPDGSPLSLTAWLPLTDATTLNGCMYMVPADRDPTYNTPQQGQWNFDYQDVRALPAAAGSILIWNQAVLHWGSHGSPREANPRISLAFEYQSSEIPPFNQPVMQPHAIPGFEMRLRLIAKQILQYQHMYPLAPDIRGAANRLLGI